MIDNPVALGSIFFFFFFLNPPADGERKSSKLATLTRIFIRVVCRFKLSCFRNPTNALAGAPFGSHCM